MSGTAEPFAPALAALETLAASGGPVIAAIDGRCGSGKTTLACLAAEALGCAVVHTDDFYLPFDRRAPDWQAVPCANMDLARLEREVLAPFSAGERAVYRPYRCMEGRFGPETVLSAGGLLLVEGSYCLHPDLAAYYELKIFLTCSPAVQEHRLRARERERFPAFRDTWIPLEEAYIRRYAAEKEALSIDTSAN